MFRAAIFTIFADVNVGQGQILTIWNQYLRKYVYSAQDFGSL